MSTLQPYGQCLRSLQQQGLQPAHICKGNARALLLLLLLLLQTCRLNQQLGFSSLEYGIGGGLYYAGAKAAVTGSRWRPTALLHRAPLCLHVSCASLSFDCCGSSTPVCLGSRAAAATTGFGVAMLPSTFMTMRFGAR